MRNPRQGAWPHRLPPLLVKHLSDSAWDGYAGLYGRRQAIHIERERHFLKTGATCTEVTYALTSLTADRASPEQLAALVRNHLHIENRLHSVRDFPYEQDRCRVNVRDLPRNLACLTNTASSIVRCQSDFQYIQEANRLVPARPQKAPDLLLNPPALESAPACLRCAQPLLRGTLPVCPLFSRTSPRGSGRLPSALAARLRAAPGYLQDV